MSYVEKAAKTKIIKNDFLVNFVHSKKGPRRMKDGKAAVPCADSDIAVQTMRRRRTRGPSVDKTAQTRQLIAEAALAEFAESGVARSTMERIARRAGVAKGTLYLYYPSKDELLRGVVAHALRHSVAYQPLKRRKGETVKAFLRRSLLPTLEAVESSERGTLARLVLSEARHAPELGRLYKELAFDTWQHYVQDLLALAVKEGELKTRSVHRSAQLLASPFWMALVHNHLLAPGASQKLALKPLIELLIDNLFARATDDNEAVESE